LPEWTGLAGKMTGTALHARVSPGYSRLYLLAGDLTTGQLRGSQTVKVALSRDARRRHGTAVRLDDLPDDGQTQAAAAGVPRMRRVGAKRWKIPAGPIGDMC
jgi:hypothetical protein